MPLVTIRYSVKHALDPLNGVHEKSVSGPSLTALKSPMVATPPPPPP